jgi:hypothetical protein
MTLHYVRQNIEDSIKQETGADIVNAFPCKLHKDSTMELLHVEFEIQVTIREQVIIILESFHINGIEEVYEEEKGKIDNIIKQIKGLLENDY